MRRVAWVQILIGWLPVWALLAVMIFTAHGGLFSVAALIALEQRIAFKLAFDIGLQLEVGHLQQLDRLLQLRRHDQGLALFEFEAVC